MASAQAQIRARVSIKIEGVDAAAGASRSEVGGHLRYYARAAAQAPAPGGCRTGNEASGPRRAALVAGDHQPRNQLGLVFRRQRDGVQVVGELGDDVQIAHVPEVIDEAQARRNEAGIQIGGAQVGVERRRRVAESRAQDLRLAVQGRRRRDGSK